ncbi:hypothetical protein [Silvanigrella aquatica]|uniref:Uncharacterized protein n=1 Tax=Silvanigrella aquatica TaxID=1915309 RepID=A0A1L4D3F0_9BACT|nr:hypothetical protein [Silvanigrella aquatica]APJ04720.1 hypothetical protein AXG55_12735 [Silvanigrella aquatica]
MKLNYSKITLFIFVFSSKIFAQSLSQEIPVQTQPLQGSGVQRVGSAPIPIPIQNIDLMAAPNVTLQRPVGIAVQPVPMVPKKMPYDTTFMSGRVIYLNGVNISSVKNQELENVNLHIDNNGNIYIDAPHYEIGVEQSYHPLMPSELPKFPKMEFRESPVPNGVYSKETGKMLQNKSNSPILPKEFAPEVPLKDQTNLKAKSPVMDTNEGATSMDTPQAEGLSPQMTPTIPSAVPVSQEKK